MIKEKRLELIRNSLKNYPFFDFLGEGKRSQVYRIDETLAVKIESDDSGTTNSAKNEYDILKRLNKYKFFPKAIVYNEELRFLVREYVRGRTIDSILDKKLFLKALLLARSLDVERINQQEMNNPYKHIYFHNNNVMMIDFERARITLNPKNVTQFVQYLCIRFRVDHKKLIPALLEYKKCDSEPNFKKIIKILKELIQ